MITLGKCNGHTLGNRKPSGGGAPGITWILHDDFSGSGALSGSVTDIGGFTWTTYSSGVWPGFNTLDEFSGYASIPAALTGERYCHIVTDTVAANGTIETEIEAVPAGTSTECTLRFNVVVASSDTDHWEVQYFPNTTNFNLNRRVGGSRTTVGSAAVNIQANDKISVTFNGDDIDVYVNDVLVIDYNVASRPLKTEDGVEIGVYNTDITNSYALRYKYIGVR